MIPYYDQDGITIYHGDALEILRSLDAEIHAVVTDPPYSSGARVEAKKPTSGQMLRGARFQAPLENDQMTTPGFVWMIREAIYALRPLMLDGAGFLSFIDWRQWPTLLGAVESTNLRVNQMVVWDKRSFGLGNGFRAQHELILYASKGTPRVVDKGIPNVISCGRDTSDDHPSPKPPELIEKLLKVVTDSGDLVVDPFMGAGATLRAAANMNRRAIGIEIEERYCEIAAKRLAQGVLDFSSPTQEAR